jgi:predicted amidohydrolase
MNNNLSAIQMVSESDPDSNLLRLKKLLTELSPDENQLVLLPENVLSFADKACYLSLAEELGNGIYQQQLAALAKQYRCYLVCGSFPVKSTEKGKVFTTSLVFSPQGELICHYHKLHLFDAQVSDKRGAYRESDSFTPGHNMALFDWSLAPDTVVKAGLAICYDLRFPALFQVLRARGADIILVSAAFTKVTGEAHWQPLLQARAIENQCYIVAANQGGVNSDGRETFGHSMIISPWGEVLTQLQYGEGVIAAGFNKSLLEEVRQAMPVIQHNRFQHLLDKK